MAGVPIHKDFGAQENKVYQICHCFRSYAFFFLPWSHGMDAMILVEKY